MKYSSKKKIYRKRKTHRKRKTVQKLKNHNKTRKNSGGVSSFGLLTGLGLRAAAGLTSAASTLGTIARTTASSMGNRAINYGSRLASEATIAVKKSTLNSMCSRFQTTYQNFIMYQCLTFRHKEREKNSNVKWEYGEEKYHLSVKSTIDSLIKENKINNDNLMKLYQCFQKNEFNDASIKTLEIIIINDYNNNKGNSINTTTNVLDSNTNTRKTIKNDYIIRLGLNHGKLYGENTWKDIQNIENNIEPRENMTYTCLYNYHYVYEYTLKPMGLDVCLEGNEGNNSLINNAKNPQDPREYKDERFNINAKCIYIQESSDSTIRGTIVNDYVYLKNNYPKITVKKIYVTNAILGTPKILDNKQHLHGINDVKKINDNIKAYDITIKRVNNTDNIKSIDDNYYHVYDNRRTDQKWYVKLAKDKGMFSERNSLTDSFLGLFEQYILHQSEPDTTTSSI